MKENRSGKEKGKKKEQRKIKRIKNFPNGIKK
jgi:hypothetical protein